MRVPSAACVPQLPDGRVLVGTRTGAARSFAGFCAFPGGTCDDDDDQLRLFTADVVAQTSGGPGLATEMPAKYVYDYMFRAQNLGQAFAASTMMLLAVLVVVVPWAMMEFGGRKND